MEMMWRITPFGVLVFLSGRILSADLMEGHLCVVG